MSFHVLTNGIYTIEISFESLNLHLDYRCSIFEKIRKRNQTLDIKKNGNWDLNLRLIAWLLKNKTLNKDIANNKQQLYMFFLEVVATILVLIIIFQLLQLTNYQLTFTHEKNYACSSLYINKVSQHAVVRNKLHKIIEINLFIFYNN